jgi:uncharacterized RDD family membrane protein YckC
MYCWKCGTWNAEGQTHCVNCAAALPAAPVSGDAPAGSGTSPFAEPAPSVPPVAHAPAIAAAATTSTPSLSAPPELEHHPVYAGFWRRFWTGFVDAIVLLPFGIAMGTLLGVGMFDTDWSRERLLLFGFQRLLGWLYSAGLESSRWQGTLGQQLLGLRVTDRLGRRVSFLRATGRHFGQILSVFTLGIGYLAMLFNRRRLTLHDWMSGCEVVRGGLEAPVTSMAVPAHAVTPLGGGAGR